MSDKISLKQFIQENEKTLTDYIKVLCPFEKTPISYATIEEYILNVQDLYNWAKSEGVDI